MVTNPKGSFLIRPHKILYLVSIYSVLVFPSKFLCSTWNMGLGNLGSGHRPANLKEEPGLEVKLDDFSLELSLAPTVPGISLRACHRSQQNSVSAPDQHGLCDFWKDSK